MGKQQFRLKLIQQQLQVPYQISKLYDANTAGTVSNLGNEVVTISDTGSVSAADLHDVNTLTNGVVSANAVTVVTGSVVDLLKVYSSGNTAGVIAGLGNESIIVTDMEQLLLLI